MLLNHAGNPIQKEPEQSPDAAPVIDPRILRADGVLVFPAIKLRKLSQRTVPPEWRERLAEMSTPNPRFKWLNLRWEPGYPWESPVDRWIIDEMVPEPGIMDEVLEQLRDYPPPSKMGNGWDAYKVWHDEQGHEHIGQFIRNPDCLITETAWKIFQETRCWARPYWVIQGPNGGHKRRFSPNEQKLLKLIGLPQDAPVPGALEYADFDERTMLALEQHSLLHHEQRSLEKGRDILGGAQDARHEAQAREFRRKLMTWLAEQVTEMDPERITKSLQVLDAPRLDFDVKDMERRHEEAESNFIETGRTDGLVIP